GKKARERDDDHDNRRRLGRLGKDLEDALEIKDPIGNPDDKAINGRYGRSFRRREQPAPQPAQNDDRCEEAGQRFPERAPKRRTLLPFAIIEAVLSAYQHYRN